ncbi:MAG: hypothetical protein EAX81_07190, partial [Candidatus Thorarchaeota archaeon]|nr:hypothetical protein [Candidatus Thorarchaeota archaeon]
MYDKRYGHFEHEALRESDKWFLEYSGIGRILKKHNVEYVNVIVEIWAGWNADPVEVQNAVE